MNNYLDYKATIWFRIPVDSKESLQKIKEKLKQGMLPAELYNQSDFIDTIGQCEPLYETEEFINPNENGGQSTIELYSGDDNGNQECIWDNSYESEFIN